MILKITCTDTVKIFGEIKEFEYYGDTAEFETKDGEHHIVPINDYQTQDFSIDDKNLTGNCSEPINHIVTGVYLMNDQGQTIERIR